MNEALKNKQLIGTWNISVNAPLNKVWEILNDSSNMAIWGRTMVKHTNAGKEYLGAVRNCELDFGGKKGTVREVTVVYEPDNQIFWSMEEDTLGMKKMMTEFIFGFKTKPINPNITDVQFEQYFIPRNFFTKLIIKYLMKPQMGKTNKLLLRDLKELVESKNKL